MTSPTPPQAPSPALGWLLAVPALFGTLISLVLPTVQTIWLSLQRGGVLRESTYVGFANYGKLLGDGEFWRAAWFTLSLVAMPLLVAVVVAPLLAVALDRAGTWPRRAGRIALSLAIVTFSPVGVAAAWMRGLAPDAPGLAGLAEGLRDPATAPGTLRLIVAAGTFGVVCALAVMAFLPALRAGSVPQGPSVPQVPSPQGPSVTPGFSGASRGGAAPAMLAVGVLVAIATVAVGLQTFSFGLVLTRGGPERSTETLAGLQYDSAFRMAEFGPGASVATLTGVILGVLGIVATVVVAASRLSVTLTPRTVPEPGAAAPTPPAEVTAGRGAGGVGMAVGIVALVVFLAVALVCAWPWIDGVLASPASEAGSPRSQVNTWVPAIGGAVVSVGVAYLAALGIGGLRPLGRGSEWLLLVFAPWLFVGTGPLGVANWQNMRNMGLIDTFLALFPPLLVSVPALLVLTLLCKGLAERTDKDFFGGVFLPSLPMAGILAGAVALMNAQDLLWPLLVAQKPALFTAPVAQMAQLGSFSAAKPDVGAATPLLVVAVALIAVVAAQLLYLDRLAITTNRSRARAGAA
ncbi:sugar ABC transporter permease [Nonomuraea angiospora]|uniref:sugar ABC transporter permease n=1 Tax=Nonomuraea angiospora TaxID=46172 RepID=UPI0029B81BB0|nr:sugar ABC transporter permease [Nonomuraea angiospora]MDX3102983.1 sugar ABC transporter permease [Nonomuraea angiospora]